MILFFVNEVTFASHLGWGLVARVTTNLVIRRLEILVPPPDLGGGQRE